MPPPEVQAVGFRIEQPPAVRQQAPWLQGLVGVVQETFAPRKVPGGRLVWQTAWETTVQVEPEQQAPVAAGQVEVVGRNN